MKESDKFYQVFQKDTSVGFFKEKKAAQEYAEQFKSNIQGYDYPIVIREMSFLDGVEEEEEEDGQGSPMNWDDWCDDNDSTSQWGGV